MSALAGLYAGFAIDVYKRVKSVKRLYDDIAGAVDVGKQSARATFKPNEQRLDGFRRRACRQRTWIADTFLRVRNLAAYAGCVIEGACPPPESIPPRKKVGMPRLCVGTAVPHRTIDKLAKNPTIDEPGGLG